MTKPSAQFFHTTFCVCGGGKIPTLNKLRKIFGITPDWLVMSQITSAAYVVFDAFLLNITLDFAIFNF